MLNAYLYRLRKSILKKPATIVLAVLAILFGFAIIKLNGFIVSESDLVRDPKLIMGAFNLIWILLFDAIFLTSISKGVMGYSVADINFHMAGPFTSKFNLLIAGMSTFRMILLIVWVLLCQASVLSTSLMVDSKDMLYLLLLLIPILFLSYGFGAYLGAKIKNSSKIPAYIGVVVIHLATIGVAVVKYINKAGSLDQVKNMGIKAFVSNVGADDFTSYFPVAGWIGMIYKGYLFSKKSLVVIGTVLLIFLLLSVVVLFVLAKFDYYEDAIEMSQRVNDLREAKKAGIDTDHASMNRKIKVGKETLKNGWGASVFFHRHLLENKRQSRFFFVNSLAILYRIIAVIYLEFMSLDFGGEGFDFNFIMVEALIFFMLLNVMVFGGGKTVFEFNRPYLFMVPEKASKKLLACILSELPEMFFDSVICGLLMVYFTKTSWNIFFGTMAFMLVYDVFSELSALVLLRVLRGLGQYTLMIMRYIVIYIISIPVVMPAIIVAIIFSSQLLFFVVGTITVLILDIILTFVAQYLVEHADVG